MEKVIPMYRLQLLNSLFHITWTNKNFIWIYHWDLLKRVKWWDFLPVECLSSSHVSLLHIYGLVFAATSHVYRLVFATSSPRVTHPFNRVPSWFPSGEDKWTDCAKNNHKPQFFNLCGHCLVLYSFFILAFQVNLRGCRLLRVVWLKIRINLKE